MDAALENPSRVPKVKGGKSAESLRSKDRVNGTASELRVFSAGLRNFRRPVVLACAAPFGFYRSGCILSAAPVFSGGNPMEAMITKLDDVLYPIVCNINTYLSNYILVFLLVAVGLWYSVKTRFVQVRCFGESADGLPAE